MLKGTKKLFPSDYDKFKDAMVEAAGQDDLPVMLELKTDISEFSFSDFQDLLTEFKYDTGLEMTGHFYTCPDCGMLHVMLEVDYADEDEEERILQ